MKNIPKFITISELSRLVNLSRPTLYKYIELYDLEENENIPDNYINLFHFIEEKSKSKEDIYNYCMINFNENTKKSMMDRLQILIKDPDFSNLLEYLVKNYGEIDYKEILKELEK